MRTLATIVSCAALSGRLLGQTLADQYTYQTEGRRDPFINLLNTGTTENRTPAKRAEGAGGLMVGELSVRGVMESGGVLVAVVTGADRRTHLLHAGDKLADGVVKAVIPQGLVVLQDVHDPLSHQTQREVRKLLHSLEEPKE